MTPAYTEEQCLFPSNSVTLDLTAFIKLKPWYQVHVQVAPMNFPACPKGRRRPKVTKMQGAPIRTDQPEKQKFTTQQEEEEPFSFVPDCLRQFSIPQPPKKRGRPKGSKNKEQSKRTLVETSCDPEAEVTFLDSGDLCKIC